MCIGIKLCSKKNCLEQERCVFPEAKTEKKIKINQCQIHKKFCSNARACEILGQCILDHPLVKKDKLAKRQLRKPKDISAIVKIITRLMPSLDRTKTKKKRLTE